MWVQIRHLEQIWRRIAQLAGCGGRQHQGEHCHTASREPERTTHGETHFVALSVSPPPWPNKPCRPPKSWVDPARCALVPDGSEHVGYREGNMANFSTLLRKIKDMQTEILRVAPYRDISLVPNPGASSCAIAAVEGRILHPL